MDNNLSLIKSTVTSVKQKWDTIKSELDFERESFYAIQIFQKNDYLQKSLVEAPETVQAAIINVCTTGLTLNPAMGFAYLVPRKNTKLNRVECILDISYRGMIHLMTSTGGARNVYAYVVYKGDTFEIEQGTEPRIVHSPKYTSKEIQGVYGVVILPDGTKQFEYIPVSELNELQQRSEMGKKEIGAWKTDKPEMCRKSVIKRLSKYIPKNDRMLQAYEAIAIDNEVNGIDFNAEKERQRNKKLSSTIKGVTKALIEGKQPTLPEPANPPTDALTAEDAFKIIEHEASNMNTEYELKQYELQLGLENEEEPNRGKIKAILDNRMAALKK